MSIELALAPATKDTFLKAQERLGMLDSEITSLARQVKVYMLISSRLTEDNISTEYDPFFGWVQFNSQPQFAINGLKISSAAIGCITDSVSFLEIEKTKTTALIKGSKMQDRINKLRSIVLPLTDWRNQRHAHLDADKVMKNVSCDLNNLYNALANLRNSTDYIQHYITNPHCITSETWDIFPIYDTETSKHISGLDRYFQQDPTIQALVKVLDTCSVQRPL